MKLFKDNSNFKHVTFSRWQKSLSSEENDFIHFTFNKLWHTPRDSWCDWLRATVHLSPGNCYAEYHDVLSSFKWHLFFACVEYALTLQLATVDLKVVYDLVDWNYYTLRFKELFFCQQ